MKEANFGFPGHNVRITETIENSYEVPYLNYVIASALEDLSEAQKFKIVRYMIRTFKNQFMFPSECYVQKKSNVEILLRSCERSAQENKAKKKSVFRKAPWVVR